MGPRQLPWRRMTGSAGHPLLCQRPLTPQHGSAGGAGLYPAAYPVFHLSFSIQVFVLVCKHAHRTGCMRLATLIKAGTLELRPRQTC